MTTLRATLDDAIGRASARELPTIIGELERAKASAYQRLLPSQGGTQGSDYLTIIEVATRLRLSRARVYELVRCGDLRSVTWGRRGTRIRRADLEEWEQRRRTVVDAGLSTMLNLHRD
jgi:excisionase family DNA binding protein